MNDENNKERLRIKMVLPCPNGCGAELEFEPDLSSERLAWSIIEPHTCPKPMYKNGWYRTRAGEMVRRIEGVWNAVGLSSCFDDNYAHENWEPLTPIQWFVDKR